MTVDHNKRDRSDFEDGITVFQSTSNAIRESISVDVSGDGSQLHLRLSVGKKSRGYLVEMNIDSHAIAAIARMNARRKEEELEQQKAELASARQVLSKIRTFIDAKESGGDLRSDISGVLDSAKR